MSKSIEPIQCSVMVKASIEEAFLTFTEKFSEWWPKSYTLSKDTLEDIGIEPKKNGFCFEIGPYGFRCDWGRVTVWEKPNRLGFTWQVNPSSTPDPNPDHASGVMVTFTEVEPAITRVDLVHNNIQRHGEGSEIYRDELASEYGWPYIIQQYGALIDVI